MIYNSIIIVGPTACGKTNLSVALAKALQSEIVGADSLQIYKKLNIGTAKVTKEEMCGVKHHMIDLINPEESFSVSEYRKFAMPIISKLLDKKITPVIVGGTGMYVDALIGNNIYGECSGNSEIRRKYADILEKMGKEYVYSLLEKCDPKTASKLHVNDVKRVIRALEIFDLTGKTKSQMEVENKSTKNDSPLKPLIIGLTLSDRELLYEKINKRVDIMFGLGLEKEVRDLIDLGLNKDTQSMQAIGYKEFFDYFDNQITKSELIEKIKQNTRHYAKRQLTYFRRMDINKWYCTDQQSIDEIVCDIVKLYNKK